MWEYTYLDERGRIFCPTCFRTSSRAGHFLTARDLDVLAAESRVAMLRCARCSKALFAAREETPETLEVA